jgi:uncharacterized protein involved in exopolysaccharide biosynthesis
MQTALSKELLPSRRDLVTRVFRQPEIAIGVFLLVIAGFFLTGQFKPKYKSQMKVLMRKQRADPILTSSRNSTPDLMVPSIPEEELNSEVEILRGDDLLHDVAIEAGLVPNSNAAPKQVAQALQRLKKNLVVSAVPKTNLISAQYLSTSPSEASHVLTVLGQLFLKKQRTVNGSSDQVSFFQDHEQQHRLALAAAEAKLVDFTRSTGVVSAEMQRDLSVKELSDLNVSNSQIRASIEDAAGRSRIISAQLQVTPERIATESRRSDNPALLEKLKSQLLTLQLRRQELLTKYDPHYRLVEEVDREIAAAQSTLDAQQNAPVMENSSSNNPTRLLMEQELDRAQAELYGLKARENVVAASSAQAQAHAALLQEKAQEQAELLRNVKTEQDQLALYTAKLEEARMTNSLDRDGILNVVIAEPPMTPVLPESTMAMILLASLFTGGVLSVGAAIAADFADPTVRNGFDLAEVMHVPLLAEFRRGVSIERSLQ